MSAWLLQQFPERSVVLVWGGGRLDSHHTHGGRWTREEKWVAVKDQGSVGRLERKKRSGRGAGRKMSHGGS
ncbi:hypothetical protein EYF80_000198 [Liparis tanakae]|uniref:Uncharacterized protein n=1 Tax=Liparis tanakae TaxID=230148 RepID=A0A4Z2JH50_9TELE|nr:hypothetical protein EYF80_000198 [Liparis tanakae]